MSDRTRPSADPAWQRWQAATLDRSAGSPSGTRPDGAPVDAEDAALAPEVVDPRALIAQWQADAERQGRQVGYQAGYQAGLQQGLDEGRARGLEEGRASAEEQGRQQLAAHQQQLTALLQGSCDAIEQLHTEVGQATIELALALAADLVRQQLAQQPQTLLPLLREVLQLDPAAGALRLWLHPDDLALVQQLMAAELAAIPCQLLPDIGLQRGGCRVQSGFGDIDATLQTRWRRLAGALGSQQPWPQPSPETAS